MDKDNKEKKWNYFTYIGIGWIIFIILATIILGFFGFFISTFSWGIYRFYRFIRYGENRMMDYYKYDKEKRLEKKYRRLQKKGFANKEFDQWKSEEMVKKRNLTIYLIICFVNIILYKLFPQYEKVFRVVAIGVVIYGFVAMAKLRKEGIEDFRKGQIEQQAKQNNQPSNQEKQQIKKIAQTEVQMIEKEKTLNEKIGDSNIDQTMNFFD